MTTELCPECDQPRPRDEEVADLYARLEALTAENERMRAVLTPSEENVRAFVEAMNEAANWAVSATPSQLDRIIAGDVMRALSERAGIK